MKKLQSLILFIALFLVSGAALGQLSGQDDPGSIAENWIMQYHFLDDSTLTLPDKTISKGQAIKAGQKIKRNLKKAIEKYEKSNQDTANLSYIYEVITNASLWYKNIQSNDFQKLLNTLLTTRQISQKTVHTLVDAYHKWIISPSFRHLSNYSELLTNTGESYEILCRLSVDNVPDNFIVKYMNLTSDNAKTLDPSLYEKVVPAGNYYIWFEAKGVVASDKSYAYQCITESQLIEFNTLR